MLKGLITNILHILHHGFLFLCNCCLNYATVYYFCFINGVEEEEVVVIIFLMLGNVEAFVQQIALH